MRPEQGPAEGGTWAPGAEGHSVWLKLECGSRSKAGEAAQPLPRRLKDMGIYPRAAASTQAIRIQNPRPHTRPIKSVSGNETQASALLKTNMQPKLRTIGPGGSQGLTLWFIRSSLKIPGSLANTSRKPLICRM